MSAIIIIAILAVAAVGVILMYNSLVKLKNQVANGWAQIEVQLTRRSELIPNLVESVKGYAAHEKEALQAVINARAAALGAQTPSQAAATDGALTGALGKIFALAEAYPNLKADANFRDLQEQLAATEDKVAYARQFYNDITTRYNTRIAVFPASLIAKSFGFATKELFEAEETHRAAPKVSF